MQQCTLYVSIQDRESVTDAIRKAFSEKTVEVSTDGRAVTVSSKKWFSKSTITFNTLREDLDPEAFDQMKRGMYGYFSQIETPHLRVQQKLLMQITALNVAVGIVSSDGIDKETFQKILEIARSVHGIVFLPTGEMLDKEGKLILDTAGESELEDFILTVS